MIHKKSAMNIKISVIIFIFIADFFISSYIFSKIPISASYTYPLNRALFIFSAKRYKNGGF